MAQLLYPKEISECKCLLRMCYNEFRENVIEWHKRIKQHYKEAPKCLKEALKNPILLNAKTEYAVENIVASLWLCEEQNLRAEWGIKSKGLNYE